MNRVVLVDRGGVHIAQQQVRNRTRGRTLRRVIRWIWIRSRAVVVESERASTEWAEFIGVVRGADFSSKLELVLAMHPREVVHVCVAVDWSLQTFLLESIAECLQSGEVDRGEIARVERVQTDLGINRAVRSRRIVEILAASVRETQFVDRVGSEIVEPV